MNSRKVIGSILALTIVAALLFAPQYATKVRSAPIGNNVLAHAYDIEMGLAQRAPGEQLVSSGAVYAMLEAVFGHAVF